MRYKSIFISDLHLGTRVCFVDALLDFLKNFDAENLVLVGDIIDLWHLRAQLYWPPSHNLVIQKVLKKARHGTKVTYIPGNHDEKLKEFIDLTFGGIDIKKELEYVSVTGKRILVIHGDEFDNIVRYARWLAILGDHGYTLLFTLNRYLNIVRKWFGLTHWSLSAFVKHKVKEAATFISNYEHAIVHECQRRNFDYVICGHIHHAEIRSIDDIIYLNDGDFVESCTALVEHFDGTFEIIKYLEHDRYASLMNLSPNGIITRCRNSPLLPTPITPKSTVSSELSI